MTTSLDPKTITPSVKWIDADLERPDDNLAVLMYIPDADEPVWLGYIEGGTWFEMDGFPVEGEVKAWCDLPKPPEIVEEEAV